MQLIERSTWTSIRRPPLATVPPEIPDEIDDESEALRAILDEFSSKMQADGAFVVWSDGHGEQVVLCASGRCTSAAAPERKLLVEPVARIPTRGVYWRTFDGPGGSWQALTTSVPTDGGMVTMNALFRRMTDVTRSRARESALLAMPLLQGLFRLWSLRRRMAARLKAFTDVLNNADMGLILVNRRGHLLFANKTAERLMDQRDGIRRCDAAVSATHIGDSMRLHAAIEHVVSAQDSFGGCMAEAAPVVALRRNGAKRPLLAAVVPSDGADGGERAAAAIYLFDPGQDLRLRLEPVCRFYGLSPVETRLACCLAEGGSVVEAAEKLRVREQTARSYLKQIFIKTATNRQAELVSLLLKSCVRTAPECGIGLV
jgi:DNA-binding CsgD family transcriptional regulator/PAS domain-containing protein